MCCDVDSSGESKMQLKGAQGLQECNSTCRNEGRWDEQRRIPASQGDSQLMIPGSTKGLKKASKNSNR